jgi:hypothetical protein
MTIPWSVHLPSRMSDELLQHLFPGDRDEHAAVLGVSVVQTARGIRLLGRRLHLARDEVDYVPGTRGYRMLTPTFVRDRVLECERDELGYLAVHCHGGIDRVAFSADDMNSHKRGYPALLDILDGAPVGALVFARDAVAGDIWLPGGQRIVLDQARLLGSSIRVLRSAPPEAPPGDHTFDRQSRMFGDRGQAILASQKVGVIGVGGAGSLVVEYLARLGVGHLVLIDPDRIDVTNLPRVVGARSGDTRPWLTRPRWPGRLRALGERLATPKVAIGRRVARQANPTIRVDALHGDVTNDNMAKHLLDCDYLFLAADSAQARLVVNAIVHQYLIPGVQIGAKIQLDDRGDVTDVFSVIRPLHPGESCLWCNQLISPARLQDEAQTSEQRRRQRYVPDTAVHAPSVITVNAVAAAHAVNDYLLAIVGLVDPTAERRWTRFHPTAGKATDRAVTDEFRRDAGCRECSDEGRLGAGSSQRLPTRPMG